MKTPCPVCGHEKDGHLNYDYEPETKKVSIEGWCKCASPASWFDGLLDDFNKVTWCRCQYYSGGCACGHGADDHENSAGTCLSKTTFGQEGGNTACQCSKFQKPQITMLPISANIGDSIAYQSKHAKERDDDEDYLDKLALKIESYEEYKRGRIQVAKNLMKSLNYSYECAITRSCYWQFHGFWDEAHSKAYKKYWDRLEKETREMHNKNKE